MAITYKIHTQNFREKQFEIFYDLLENGKTVSGNQIYPIGKEKVDAATIEKLMAEKIIPGYETLTIVEPEEKTYQESEVTDILKEKGYLTAEQSFDDLSINTKG